MSDKSRLEILKVQKRNIETNISLDLLLYGEVHSYYIMLLKVVENEIFDLEHPIES